MTNLLSVAQVTAQTDLFTSDINKLHQLVKGGRHYTIGRHQVVQSSDDRYRSLVNLISKGYVKRYEITSNGSIAVQALYGPGVVFPLGLIYKALFNRPEYDGQEIIFYQTITEAEIYSVDVQLLVDAIRNDPTIYKDLLIEAGSRPNVHALENMSLKNSLKRTAHQLLFCAREFGQRSLLGTKIMIPLTHQDIADILNLTRETVSVNMCKLQKRRLIKSGQRIEVLNVAGLEELVYA